MSLWSRKDERNVYVGGVVLCVDRYMVSISNNLLNGTTATFTFCIILANSFMSTMVRSL